MRRAGIVTLNLPCRAGFVELFYFIVRMHRSEYGCALRLRGVCYRVGADDPCRRSDGARQLSLSLTPVLLRCFLCSYTGPATSTAGV